jgi:hypothetical protein
MRSALSTGHGRKCPDRPRALRKTLAAGGGAEAAVGAVNLLQIRDLTR